MPTLEFKGKPFVYSHHFSVPFRELIIDKGKSEPPDGAPSLDGNLIIHGDNLEGLKALLPRYAGKVDVIYIDPPYNTGNEGWAYNDNVNAPALKAWLGKVVDREDLERHDKWASMMLPRLRLLSDLLSESGLIACSLDDNEIGNARLLFDEIFGQSNFIVQAPVITNLKGNQDEFGFAGTHEYLLIYAKDKAQCAVRRFPLGDEATEGWSQDEIGPFKSGAPMRATGAEQFREDREGMFYPLLVASDDAVTSIPEAEFKQIYDENRKAFDDAWVATLTEKYQRQGYTVVWPRTDNDRWGRWRWGYSAKNLDRLSYDVIVNRGRGQVTLYKKQRPELGELPSAKPKSLFYRPEYSSTSAANELKAIIGREAFSHIKARRFIEDVIYLLGPEDAVVLDSFAGSGTTAHAVLALNKGDGGNRKFILVETEDYADTLTAERVRRVIKGVSGVKEQALRAGLGGSFTYCELGAPMELERFFAGEGEAPEREAVARYVAWTATGETLVPSDGADGFVGHAGHFRLHLLYRPDAKWMRSNEAMLDLTTAERIAAAAKTDGGKGVIVFAAGKLMGQRTLNEFGITFAQLPFSVHRILGEGTEGVAGVDEA